MATRLRKLFPASPQTGLTLTGAPQCAVPDPSMGQLIVSVAFDALFIRFYNTPGCSARAWANANPNYVAGTRPFPSGGFTYDTWTNALASSASSAAKLYLGLAGSEFSVDDTSYYINQNETTNLINAYFCNRNFGGVAIWDAEDADENVLLGQTFTQWTKTALTNALQNPAVRSCRGAVAGEKA